MTPEPQYIDYENGFNGEILRRLDLPLGELPPHLIDYFEQCTAGLSENSAGKGMIKGYPVYADPESGIIFAAVCGQSGIALRFPQEWRGELLKAGAKEHLTYGDRGVTLGNRFGGIAAGWLVTDGTLDVERVQKGLSEAQSRLRLERQRLIAAKAAPNPVKADHPMNARVMAFLQQRHPDAKMFGGGDLGYHSYLGFHPDIADYVWNELPRYSGINSVGWIVYNTLTLVHPVNGIIFAFYCNEENFGLWLPETARMDALQVISPGGAKVHPYPEVGDAWIRFDPFAFKQESSRWLADSFTSIGSQ